MGWTTPKTWAAAVLTSAEMNEQVRDNLNHLKANITLEAAVELTISGGVVTKTKAYHTIDTEDVNGQAASDDLDTINGGTEGDVIFVTAEHDGRTVVLKDQTGNIHLGGDIYLGDTHKLIALIYDGSHWHALGAYAMVREFLINGFVSDSTDWIPQVEGIHLAQNKVAKKCWLPLPFFKIGDIFISYKLVGDATEAAALTLDCKLVRINLADPLTTTDPDGGDITQVDAIGNFDSEAILTTPEVVATDKQYTLEILGTTGAGDTITIIGAEVKAIRLL